MGPAKTGAGIPRWAIISSSSGVSLSLELPLSSSDNGAGSLNPDGGSGAGPSESGSKSTIDSVVSSSLVKLIKVGSVLSSTASLFKVSFWTMSLSTVAMTLSTMAMTLSTMAILMSSTVTMSLSAMALSLSESSSLDCDLASSLLSGPKSMAANDSSKASEMS